MNKRQKSQLPKSSIKEHKHSLSMWRLFRFNSFFYKKNSWYRDLKIKAGLVVK
jgi:hypothetical protein